MSASGVIDIFRKVLEIEEVQVDSDFFVLGGDSLLATRVLSAIAREYGAELTFADLLSAPSPSALSQHIASLGR
jgi:acyl carrier protein